MQLGVWEMLLDSDENSGGSCHASGGQEGPGEAALTGPCSLGCLTQSVSFGRLLRFVQPRLRLGRWSRADTLPSPLLVLTGAQRVAKSAIPAVRAGCPGLTPPLPFPFPTSLSQRCCTVGDSVNMVGQSVSGSLPVLILFPASLSPPVFSLCFLIPPLPAMRGFTRGE